MRAQVYRPGLFGRYVSIDLRCCRTAVPEKILDYSEVGSAIEQVGSEAVSQRMSVEVWIESGSNGVFFDDSLY